MEFENTISNSKNVNIIFADSASKITNIGYESWFTNFVDNTSGIWIGSGVADQSVLRTSVYDNVLTMKLPNDFGWVFQKGELYLIKLVSEKIKNEK